MMHVGTRRGNGGFRGSPRGGTSWRGRGRGASGGLSDSHGICRFYQLNGSCKFGVTCKFSHDNIPKREKKPREEETAAQLQARGDYNYWKRFLKSPPRTNGEKTALQLWSGALKILDGDEREWKQMLPRDLDNEETFGRLHIKDTMSVRSRLTDYNGSIEVALAFLRTITHHAILDCLSVDTYVGSMYNFVSGANGTRAIPFFQHVNEIIGKAYGDVITPGIAAKAEQLVIATSLALREILRRESRARFNEHLPSLLDSIENLVQMICEAQSQACTIVTRHVVEMRAVVDRANRLLTQEDDVQELLQPCAAPSSYPRSIQIPQDRYDNDKADVSQMEIFPTREEILTDVPDFLPLTDKDQPHFIVEPVQRHIDTNFRLLRYDTFGELKEALGNLMHAIEADPTSLKNPRLSFGDFRASHYTNCYISYLSFDQRRGLEVKLSFPQLQNLRGKSPSERRKWWEDSRRLSEGILLSYITLHEDVVQHIFLTVTLRETDNRKEHSLTNEERHVTITAKLARHNQKDVETLVRLSCEKTRGVLIEFPGVLPATFMPVLANLQEMNRIGRLPFQQWILPGRTQPLNRAAKVDIPPPLYARGAFHFSLEPILKVNALGGGDLRINPASVTLDDPEIIREMEIRTELDLGQCHALLAVLSREFAFVQGPPGTGKSFLGVQLMKVLMECKTRASLGPVVVVCYTNHALDQFLEHLIETGIRKIVRLGGQSHSTLLEDHNLRKVAQAESKTRSEGYILGTSYDALEKETKRIQGSLGKIHGANRAEWKHLQYHLVRRYPMIYRQFPQMDEDGFEVAGRHPFEIWASKGITPIDAVAAEENASALRGDDVLLEKAARDVHSLTRVERGMIRNIWAQEMRDDALDDVFEKVKDTERIQRQITNVHDEIDRRVLQDADVIGITTTGLAKRIATLQRVRCKVIICEEAGEVMEPHMISALLPAAEHFIQIGDHEQLRPQINNFKDLSLESRKGLSYQLDRSQFERLSVGEPGRLRMPVAQLNVQRRMRPEASRLIRETIYPGLIDHPSVSVQPDVVGMRKNVFWMDHDQLEDNQRPDMHHKSYSNVWEVDMVHAMVRHIVRQGAYKSSEIAVLTPYTGQLQKLRAAMRDDFEIVLSDRDQEALDKDGFQDDNNDPLANKQSDLASHRKAPLTKKKLSDLLRVATVDNFQGEEAKVVIISLVRSNDIPKVGFLKTTNRINVLLSRVQHGMYLFGNANTYSYVPMWEKALKCGHQCPGLCGETCPETLCQKCTEKQDSRVDLYLMKTYVEIDIDEYPIVVLGCGHFFTAESLDGMIGLTEVYTSDKFGQINGLVDISGSLVIQIPRCPDCQLPVRQYVTQRYNRVINRAVIDELSKRFLVNGQAELRNLEKRVAAIEKELEISRAEITISNQTNNGILPLARGSTDAQNRAVVFKKLQKRYGASFKLAKDVALFLRKVADRHQPAQKLHEATVHAIANIRSSTLEDAIASLGMHETIPLVERDRRVVLGGRILQIRIDCMVLEDKFRIPQAIRKDEANPKLPGGLPETLTGSFLTSCSTFIRESTTANIPKLAVEASLYFATVAGMYQSSGLTQEIDKAKAADYAAEAKVLLETALESCKLPFQNADKLAMAVEESLELLRRSRYEDVTAEELAMIKTAMVSGSRGIASHSGHWYNCVNGHPFAIGECVGVTRAVNMEG
ncbi:uncharacterized protein N0V89_005926 [Didymosphaeria variabile]|uniref:C3H1-type domain-containing protein n=1 Tax=Didymosphaeria variabile TaxID=1932322 RepID=A0A9W8XLM1_9PLEO|nr:uncharacterized protein N0V89_005926 [Didymosphaeria variabile]KAJ4354192.1 hypothetical protein N0V89_005926 [Didymosphaeria variabile]